MSTELAASPTLRARSTTSRPCSSMPPRAMSSGCSPRVLSSPTASTAINQRLSGSHRATFVSTSRPAVERLSACTAAAVPWLEPLARDAVRDHPGVDPAAPHLVLHEAADGRDRHRLVQLPPRHSVEAEAVVRVPVEAHVLAQASFPRATGEPHDAEARVPFLGDDDDWTMPLHEIGQEVLIDPGGKRDVPIVELAFLAIVDTATVVEADPLAPPMKVKMAIVCELVARQVGCADIKQVCFVALVCKRGGKTAHACSQAARARIRIGTFEAQQNECGTRLRCHTLPLIA